MQSAIKRTVGSNLRRIRTEKAMSQTTLAKAIGQAPSWVSSVEAGKRGVGPNLLLKLCKALEIEPALLYAQKYSPYAQSEDEQGVLDLFREARDVGVAEEWVQYGRYKLSDAKKKRQKHDREMEAHGRRKYPKKKGQHEAMDEGKTVRPQEQYEPIEEDAHRSHK